MRQIGLLQTVQVGTPQQLVRADGAGGVASTLTTSFVREPSPAQRWLFTTHLEGNIQADRESHGHPDQAVLMYAAAHYPVWRAEFGRAEIGPGGFGENFTVAGLDETTACIGDSYAIGAARIQINGPRYPCTKIERRWGLPGLTARVAETGRTGWYCHVPAEGLIVPGLPVLLAERPYPEWTVALVNDFGHCRNTDLARAKELAACPLLNDWWQRLVVRRAQGHEW